MIKTSLYKNCIKFNFEVHVSDTMCQLLFSQIYSEKQLKDIVIILVLLHLRKHFSTKRIFLMDLE